jgi:hypothetical protein
MQLRQRDDFAGLVHAPQDLEYLQSVEQIAASISSDFPACSRHSGSTATSIAPQITISHDK